MSQLAAKLAVTNLFYSINLKLQAYKESRKSASNVFTYAVLMMTGFLALPFFPSLFRNKRLTKIKIDDVDNTLNELKELENSYQKAPNPEHSIFIEDIQQILIKLNGKNNHLHVDFNKKPLSERQLTETNQQRKKTFFQSGLTNTLDACFEIIKNFKLPAPSSSTINIHSSIGSTPAVSINTPPPSAPPQYSTYPYQTQVYPSPKDDAFQPGLDRSTRPF